MRFRYEDSFRALLWDASELKKKVTLISYSLGAQVALKFASEEVERVNGVGIVNGTLEPAFYGLFRSEMLSDGIIRALRWS